MNRYLKEHGDLLPQATALRNQLMDILTDADLGCDPGGANLTLGELCKESGDIEMIYIQSLKTHTMDWSYRNPDAGLATSVAKLRDWFTALDAELLKTIENLSDTDDFTIDRAGEFHAPIGMQLHIYREGLLIFYGKAMIYLKALNKPLPDQWRSWIG